MYSNAKAIRLIQDINDLLTVRLANNAGLNTVSQGFYVDANNASWPYLLISHNGNVAEGQPVIYIEISNVDAVSKDIFGNQTYAYAPHILQFAYELSGAAGSNPIPAHSDIASCEFEAIKSGVRFQLKELANGNQVSSANVNAAAPVADLDQLYWPTKLV
jgi:hypothetical protein